MASDSATCSPDAGPPCLKGRLGCKLPEQRCKPDPTALRLPLKLAANIVIKPDGDRTAHDDGSACHLFDHYNSVACLEGATPVARICGRIFRSMNPCGR